MSFSPGRRKGKNEKLINVGEWAATRTSAAFPLLHFRKSTVYYCKLCRPLSARIGVHREIFRAKYSVQAFKVSFS
jgi:hypothetical protein